MNNTCREAYDIYVQYNSTKIETWNKVKSLSEIIENMTKYQYIRTGNLQIIVMYAEQSIGKVQLTDKQKGELVNSISKVEIVTFKHNKQPINALLIRLMNAIMN